MPSPLVLLESFAPGDCGRSFLFAGFRGLVEARSAAEVVAALLRVEEAVDRGLHAAGWIAYEAAPAFDPCLPAHPHATGALSRERRGRSGGGAGEAPGHAPPLLRFALFDERREGRPPFPLPGEGEPFRVADAAFALDRVGHAAAVEAIRARIAAGDCYQANLTFPLRFRLEGPPSALYRSLCRAQRAPFCAFLDFGDTVVASASPELFFRLDGRRIVTRPMKGTAPRAPLPEEDRRRAEALRESPKERAENLMIVDLLRNDLGRACVPGSVRVPSLFAVESYETVHQMTSTVEGTLREGASFLDVLSALFPCGSVTGAPKRKAMEILASLEGSPRGIYTGAVGYLSPGGEAAFSVAIRTTVLDPATGKGVLGIGSGITWDSDAGAEHDECLAKAAFLLDPPPAFDLVETMRAEGGEVALLRRHLSRLAASASRLGFPFDEGAVRRAVAAALEGATGGDGGTPRKVRLLLSRSGELRAEASPLPEEPSDRPVAFARAPADPGDPLLYHKTTRRPLYDRERGARPEAYDVLFVNGRGEVTEGTFNNVAVRRGGRLLTPPVRCGLLPGVLRQEMIDRGELEEALLSREDVEGAEELLLLNALRGARRVRLLPR